MDEVFGRYRLRGLLGAGGMGQVYRAYDTELDREVAIKVLPAQTSTDPSFEQRFRREARTAAGLGEPHVVPIYDSGEINGRLFIAMQLIDGTNVATLLAHRGSLSAEAAVSIVTQAAAALDAAHDAGLVHRDVKPANLLITPKDFVYLIDFGIARAPGETKLTNTGSTIGTTAYMSPERFTAGTVDHSADVYALACVLHECLTGSKPFPDNSVEQQMFAHVHAPRPRPSVTGVAPGFDHVIATGMAVDPQQRYRTAGALAAAARGVVNARTTDAAAAPTQLAPTGPAAAPTVAAATPPAPRWSRSRRKRVVAVAIAALLTVAAITGVAVWMIKGRSTSTGVTIAVGRSPSAIAVDPSRHIAYVTNLGDDTVSVIDTATNTVTTTVTVGAGPSGIAVDPTTHIAYAISLDGTVSVIDATNTVTATISGRGGGPGATPDRAGAHPTGIAVDPAAHAAYTANRGDNTVWVIDTTTNAITAVIPVGRAPRSVAVDRRTQSVYVTNQGDDTVSVIDTTTRTVTATIPVDPGPSDVVVDPRLTLVFVTSAGAQTVAVIDGTTHAVARTIPVGKHPIGIAVDPGTHAVYVTNQDDDTVSVIEPGTRIPAAIRTGGKPSSVAVDPDTHTVYVTNADDHTVSVITPP